MRAFTYDVLPVSGGLAILRCGANGRTIDRQRADETQREFINRCRSYCDDKATVDRPVQLFIRDSEGVAFSCSSFVKEVEP